MHVHGSDGLEGPRRGSRSWWRGLGGLTEDLKDGRAPEEESGPETQERDPSIRWDLVDRVKSEIAAGTYDTAEKWQAALDRLMDRLEDD